MVHDNDAIQPVLKGNLVSILHCKDVCIYIYLHAYLQWVHWQKQYTTISVAFTVSAVFVTFSYFVPPFPTFFDLRTFKMCALPFAAQAPSVFVAPSQTIARCPCTFCDCEFPPVSFCAAFCVLETHVKQPRDLWVCEHVWTFFWTCSHDEFSSFLFRTCEALARLWR